MKPLGLFVLPLYHRGAFFAMNSARTKPVLYPNDTQYKPNRRIQLRNFSAAPFGVWSLGELSRCVKGAQGFSYTDKSAFEKSLRVPVRADL